MTKKTFFSIFLILLLLSCNRVEKESTSQNQDTISAVSHETIEPIKDSMMVPKDLLLPSPSDQLPSDTITPKGNSIRYRITKDTLCSDNVYIEWGNATFKRIYICPGVRQLRGYFMPRFVQETKEYLIFEHGCATDCQAVLFLPLNSSEEEKDITFMIDYDVHSYTVIREHEICSDEMSNEKNFLEAINIKSNKTKRLIFQNSAVAARRRFTIDSSRITKDWIYISAGLYDRQKEKDTTEILKVRNDLR